MKMYSISKRRKETGTFFYVRFKYDDTGSYGNAMSIDALSKRLGDRVHHVTKRPEVESIVRRAIEAGLDGNERRQDPVFIDFLQSFWDFDSSYYAKRENRKKENSRHRAHFYNMTLCVNRHIRPFLPDNLRCSQVKRKHIERIQAHCIDDVSVNTWHMTLKALSVPIRELMKQGCIVVNPLYGLDVYEHSGESTVGTLTERETEKLIIQMFNDSTYGYTVEVKRGSKAGTKTTSVHVFLDRRVYLATALAADTGMRIGEILGLMLDDISFPNDGDDAETQAIIQVRHSFSRHDGLKSPKSVKSQRPVAVSKWLARELVEFAQTNPYCNGFVFYSDISDSKPVCQSFVDKWFNRELNRIGITEEERRERHIVFHSLRHYADSEMLSRLGYEKTQWIMGHSSKAMSDRYDTADKTMRILNIGHERGSLIPNPNEMEA